MTEPDKYGPSRGELKIRLAISVVGFALLGGVLGVHGLPEGPGLIEVFGVAGLFFGITMAKAVRGLLR